MIKNRNNNNNNNKRHHCRGSVSLTHLLTPAVFNMHTGARCLLSGKEGKSLIQQIRQMNYCKCRWWLRRSNWNPLKGTVKMKQVCSETNVIISKTTAIQWQPMEVGQLRRDFLGSFLTKLITTSLKLTGVGAVETGECSPEWENLEAMHSEASCGYTCKGKQPLCVKQVADHKYTSVQVKEGTSYLLWRTLMMMTVKSSRLNAVRKQIKNTV